MPDSARENHRPLPLNFEAEMALLGALLSSGKAYDQVGDFLCPEHFADMRHGEIYRAISLLADKGHQADPITLKNHFEAAGSLKEIGGWEYLAKLAGSSISLLSAGDYGKTIRDRWLRRRAIDELAEINERLHAVDIEDPVEAIVQECEARLQGIMSSNGQGEGPRHIKYALQEALTQFERAHQSDKDVLGIPTGLAPLDALTGGMCAPDLIILAGRPSMGKTALATTILRNAASAGYKGLAFSLEMSGEQLAGRLLAEAVGKPTSDLRRGKAEAGDFIALTEQTTELSKLPIEIDDTGAVAVSQIRSRARRAKRSGGLDFVVIDYLQLIAAAIKTYGRNDLLTHITGELKAMAKELNVPVLALSQLSREVEKRDDKRPMMADLRDSGAIEQDADAVWFIYREAYYHQRLKPMQKAAETPDSFKMREEIWFERLHEIKNRADLIVSKQRNGPISEVALWFNPQLTAFKGSPPGKPEAQADAFDF